MGEHAKERFESVTSSASVLLEKRKTLLERKTRMQSERSLSATERYDCSFRVTASEQIAFMRMKTELEETEQSLSQLMTNIHSITSSFLKSTNSALDTAFNSLFSIQSPTPQLSSTVHQPYKPLYDLDSLLSSAFKQTASQTASVNPSVLDEGTLSAGGDTPRLSLCDSMLSAPHECDSVRDRYDDIPSGLDTPATKNEILSTSSCRESCREGPSHRSSLSLVSVPSQLHSHHAHLIVVNQHTSTSQEMLQEVGYDIAAIATHPDFILLLTSRGNVLSLPRSSSLLHPRDSSSLSQSHNALTLSQSHNPLTLPLASGLVDASNTQPSLIPSFQLERAIRNKRYTAVACGDCFSLALASTGEVYSWGEGANGELGQGDIASKPQPEVVDSRRCQP